MTVWRVGMRAVCIGRPVGEKTHPPGPQVGDVSTVVKVGHAFTANGVAFCLGLAGWEPARWGYAARWFRPLVDADRDRFRELLTDPKLDKGGNPPSYPKVKNPAREKEPTLEPSARLDAAWDRLNEFPPETPPTGVHGA